MAHIEKHLKSSDFVTDIVIGMSDGLTVPFALAAGLSGAVSSNSIVITGVLPKLWPVVLQWAWVVTLPERLNRIIIRMN